MLDLNFHVTIGIKTLFLKIPPKEKRVRLRACAVSYEREKRREITGKKWVQIRIWFLKAICMVSGCDICFDVTTDFEKLGFG